MQEAPVPTLSVRKRRLCIVPSVVSAVRIITITRPSHAPTPDPRVRADTDRRPSARGLQHAEQLVGRERAPVRDLPGAPRRVDGDTDTLVGDVIVRTLPAYNRPDGPHTDESGAPHHPEGRGCGFLVTIDGLNCCWPGDTDVLAGHDALDVDVFFPPIGGTFTMDRHAAAELAADLDPELVIPVHYDTFESIEADAAAFASTLEAEGVSVVIET
jgi:L-ascorbate metabolism protein UlaG (beta-lactamase superfamily)